MAKKQFKAESKRLLDLMINSIYTHKEIFLRELISNASDAIDKRYYYSLTKEAPVIEKKDLEILIDLDKENRTITLIDNGIGLDDKDMEDNLGVIASSGSLAFKKAMDEKKDIDIIGQFGVGFYSAFMVSDKIEVISKKYNSENAYKWVSEGEDGYSITKAQRDDVGTTIIMTLKENTKDENYSDYLETYKITELIKKYSDYVRYPIKMKVLESVKTENSDDYQEVEVIKTLNSMIPLWKRNKKGIKSEEYYEFYQSNFNDFQEPLKTVHFSVEGNVSFDALLFIPKKAPYDYYTKNYQRGLKLYSRNVFIMEKAEALIPEYFQFVKGLVDSQDLSLNISREILQHDRQLKIIANKVEKKIKTELEKMLESDRSQYEEFYNAFGVQLKYGIYSDFGAHKDTLQDLLMFYSSTEKKLVTLKEYLERMKEGQEFIYYACGDSIEKIDNLPQLEVLKDKDYEILYLSEDVDEFALSVLQMYNEKKFKSVNQGDLDLDDQEIKEKIEKNSLENKDLLTLLKDSLSEQVSDVIISSRLKNAPVCLSSKEGVSLEMEKVLNQMPDGQKIKAEKILEINGDHELFTALTKLYEKDQNLIKDYADLLYNQACLIEGFSIENPLDFSNKLVKLMVLVSK